MSVRGKELELLLARHIGTSLDIDVSGISEVCERSLEIHSRITGIESVLGLFNTITNQNIGCNTMFVYNPGDCFSDCCTIEGDSSFAQKQVEAICLSRGNKFCMTELLPALSAYNFRYGAGNQSIDSRLVDAMLDVETKNIARNVDKLVFRGDTSLSSADPTYCTLHWYDGLLKQADDDANTNKIDITTGNIFDAIDDIIGSLPDIALEAGRILVFVGTDVARKLQLYYKRMNLYNFNPPDVSSPLTRLPYLGNNNIEIVPTVGLTGTNRIFATVQENLYHVTNLREDMLRADFGWCPCENSYWYWYVNFIFGVTYLFSDFVVVGSITSDVLNASVSLPVSIVSPLNATGDKVAVENTPV